MEQGWIKLHRKMLENPIIQKPNYFALWVILLLKANHKETKFMWNGNIIVVKEGQFITGRKELAKETSIPESTIEDILKYLERQHQIQQQKTTKYRVITIVNWVKHQDRNTKSNNKATTKQQQSNTNKNDNNVKNDNKDNGDKSQDIPIKKNYTKEGAEILKAFESIDGKNKTYYANKTQREACEFLIKEYGLEQVIALIPKLAETNKKSVYQITTPWEMKEKITKVFNDVKRQSSSNKKSNYYA